MSATAMILEVSAEIDAIVARQDPMPTYPPLSSGLCGFIWHDGLPWGPERGPGLLCTEEASQPGQHAGPCRSTGPDGTVYGLLREKTRLARQQVPEPIEMGGTS